MKKKLRIKRWTILYGIICILAFVLFLIFGTDYRIQNARYLESTEQNDIAFQSVNSKDGSVLLVWKTPEGGERIIPIGTDKTRFQILDDIYYNDQIYLQYQYQNQSGERMIGIGRYHVKNDVLSMFDMKDLKSEAEWCAFGEKNEKLYFLMLDREDKVLREYAVLTKNVITCEQEQEIAYPQEHYIVNANYANNRVNVCLENGTAYYIEGSKVKYYATIEESPFISISKHELNEAAYKMWRTEILLCLLKESIFWWALVAVVLGICLAGLTGRHSFILKLFIWIELAFVLMSTVMFISCYKKIGQDTVSNIFEKGITVLQKIPKQYNASGEIDYQLFYTIAKQSEIKFEEIVILERENGKAVIKHALQSPANVVTEGDGYYGKRFSNLVNALTLETPIINKQLSDGYVGYQVILYKDTNDIDSDRVIIGFIDNVEAKIRIEGMVKDIFKQVLPIWLCINLLIILIILLYQIRWRRFTSALMILVKKHERYEEQKKVPNELVNEWKALDEVYRIFSRTQYEKAQNLDAYNQFVPKGIEKLLDCKSILDVELGDYAEIQGSVVTINLDAGKFSDSQLYLRTMKQAFEVVNDNVKVKDGIMISQDSGLTNTKILFRENVDRAIEFAIETLHTIDSNIHLVDKEKIFVLNFSKHQCGMTGCEERLLPYIYSEEDTVLSNNIEFLRRAGVKLVLTEYAAEHCNTKYAFRYIGFITDKGKNIKLFECLDAYSALKKELLMNTQKVFKKALGLFYSNDFYLARNTFNQVLKENPDDKIARWYLFNCEHNLNLTGEQEVSYGLFENKIYEQQYQQK